MHVHKSLVAFPSGIYQCDLHYRRHSALTFPLTPAAAEISQRPPVRSRRTRKRRSMTMLPPSVPELIDLELLLCVERLGSLSKAARAHSIAQPTASVRIQAVERRLGLRLLDRSPTGCQLTSAGRMVTQWARGVVEAAAELATRTAALRDGQHGRLRVAASLTVADHLIPHWFIALREQFPEVSVDLQVHNSSEVVDHLSAGLIDLGFVEDPCSHADLAETVIGHDELVVVVAPCHPWSERTTPLTPEELMSGPLVLRERGCGTRDALERAVGGLADNTSYLELASTNAVKTTVVAGTGAAVLSVMTVQDELRDGRLVCVPMSGGRLVRQFEAVWDAHVELSPPAQFLIKVAGAYSAKSARRKEIRSRSRAAGGDAAPGRANRVPREARYGLQTVAAAS